MKRKNKLQALLICLLCFILVFPVQAGISSTEDKLTSANDRLTKLQKSRSSLQTYMGELNTQLTELSDTLNELDKKQENKEQEIEQTETELDNAREKETEQYDSMKLRIQYMYENGDLDILTIIFGSDSLTDMLNKLEFVTQITEYDRNMLVAYQETMDTIALKEGQLKEELEELSVLHNQTLEEQQTVSALLQEASGQLGQFDTDIASAQQQISDYEAELLRQEEAIRAKMETVPVPGGNDDPLVADNSGSTAKKDPPAGNTTDKKGTDNADNGSSTDKGNSDNSTGNTNGNNNGGNGNGGGNSGQPGNYSDLELLAAIIECEAGGESTEGKVAVGNVIMNRVRNGRFPNTVLGVIYQSGQFAPVSSGRFALVLARGANSSCTAAASRAMAGESPAGSCLYFNNTPAVLNAGIEPTYIIGNHAFY